MAYHIVSIDSPQCSLSCRDGQLTCRTPGAPDRSVPLEDVASIIVTSFSAQISSHLLLEAARHGVSLIICECFKPASLMLPANRSTDTVLTRAQVSLPDKTRRRLWGDAATNAWLEERLPALEAGQATPFGIADALLSRSADLLTRTS